MSDHSAGWKTTSDASTQPFSATSITDPKIDAPERLSLFPNGRHALPDAASVESLNGVYTINGSSAAAASELEMHARRQSELTAILKRLLSR